jgi:hypothetical protein
VRTAIFKLTVAVIGMIAIFILSYWMFTEAWGLEIQNMSAFILYAFGQIAITLIMQVICDS